MPKGNITLSIDSDVLLEIDAAARAIGENRSKYMTRASLLRLGDHGELSQQQQQAITAMLEAFGK